MWDQVKQALNQSTTKFLTETCTLAAGNGGAYRGAADFLRLGGYLCDCGAALARRHCSFDERLERWGFASLAEWSPMNSPAFRLANDCLSGHPRGIFDRHSSLRCRIDISARSKRLRLYPEHCGRHVGIVSWQYRRRFLARSVLIGAVNMNLQYARLLSLGVKWLVIVLAVAMALDQLKIAPGIVDLAFGILFGGIVLALVLAVGLNSKELVTKSLERDAKKAPREEIEDPLRHL